MGARYSSDVAKSLKSQRHSEHGSSPCVGTPVDVLSLPCRRSTPSLLSSDLPAALRG